ncbi:DUF1360 domain-containing protein [Candidatus Parcubacteria bacterium]|nr:MAG: DUF1360 domain-containing protein [Candidatus Parcubacteria bacterium]
MMSLATFRLTHLFTYDSVTDFVRNFFKNSASGFGRSLSELIHCPWCTGVWTALLVGFLYYLSPVFWYLLLLIALAGLGSFIQTLATIIIRYTPERKSYGQTFKKKIPRKIPDQTDQPEQKTV